MAMAKQDDYARYTIRVPKDIYSAIEAAAQDGGRSVNAEIINRLALTIDDGPFEKGKHDEEKVQSPPISQEEFNLLKNSLNFERQIQISQRNTLYSFCKMVSQSECSGDIRDTAEYILFSLRSTDSYVSARELEDTVSEAMSEQFIISEKQRNKSST